MILAAYIVTGFLVASVYAVGMLRGRRDRHHRLGLLIPFTIAAIATPIQFGGGRHGGTPDRQGPAGQVRRDGVRAEDLHTHVTEYLGGRCTGGREGRNRDPGFDSWLVGFSTDTEVIGWTPPPDDGPS